MPTEVIRTIGAAAGRDYATIQAWIDAAPASLVTDDVVWIGELYNDSLYSFSGNFSGGFNFGTKTTDATRYFWLRAAKGQGFRDRNGPLTRPTTERGVFLQTTQTNAGMINGSSKIVLTGLQIEVTQTSGSANPTEYDSCVFFTRGILSIPLSKSASNCLIVHGVDSSTTTSIADNFDGVAVGTIRNCTIVSLQTRSFASLGNSSGKRYNFQNCLFAGYTTLVNQGANLWISNPNSKNNYSSTQQMPGFDNRTTGLQWPFVGSNDFRPLAIDQLYRSKTSSSYQTDIYGNARGAFSYYGCVEGVLQRDRKVYQSGGGFKSYWATRKSSTIGAGNVSS